MITFEEANRLVRYEPETGKILWSFPQRGRRGLEAGTITKTGYRQINLCGKFYGAHRLAWFLTYGEWPKNLIDHINMNRSDNRLCNLREATQSQNQMNRPKPSSNTSGIKGVIWIAKQNRFWAQYTLRGKIHHVGSFKTKEAAGEALKAARILAHGEFANHG